MCERNVTSPIFPSCASQDAEVAQRICDAPRAAGLEACFDPRELRGGNAWDTAQRQAPT